MYESKLEVAAAHPTMRTSKFARSLALLLGFAMLCFGLVAGGGAAQAAGDHTVSGTIQFPASAPSELRVPWGPDGADGYVGIYLTLYVKQDGPVEGWQLGEDANVSFDSASGAWAVTDVPDGEYRLSISVSLPNNGYAPGTFQELTVSGADVTVGTTSIAEEGRLRAAIARCGWELGDEIAFFVENVTTGTVYEAEPAQSGWVEPSTDCPPEVSYGNYSFSGMPAGDYTAYSVWNEPRNPRVPACGRGYPHHHGDRSGGPDPHSEPRYLEPCLGEARVSVAARRRRDLRGDGEDLQAHRGRPGQARLGEGHRYQGRV
jgi:hypothetical protein